MKNRHYSLWLCAACIVIFIVQVIAPSFTDAFILNEKSWQQPWRFITALFLHADIMHLLYNMFALALFGAMLEHYVGSKKFLLAFFIPGIIANVIAVNVYTSSLGASGAIFGVIGALMILRPMLVVWTFGLPMPLVVAGILWIGGDIIGTFVPSNIGTVAHLSGIAIGMILGSIYRKTNPQPIRQKQNKLYIDEKSMRQWEDDYLN